MGEKDIIKQDDSDAKIREQLLDEFTEHIPSIYYDLIKLVSDYYIIFKDKGLSESDHVQLTILFACARFNERYVDYLHYKYEFSLLIFASEFGINDISYYESPIDIYIICDHFAHLKRLSYCGWNKDLALKEILASSFHSSSFKFKKALLNQGIDEIGQLVWDWIDICNFVKNINPDKISVAEMAVTEKEASLEAARKAEEDERKAEETHKRIQFLWKSLDAKTKKMMQDTINIYEYLDNCSLPFVEESKDKEKLSLLIGFLLNDLGYLPFFEQNGITLDSVLSMIHVDKNDIIKSLHKENNSNRIITFEKYFSGILRILEHYQQKKSGKQMEVSPSIIIRSLFDDRINDSAIIEKIASDLECDYDALKQEVLERKEKIIEKTATDILKELKSLSTPSIDNPTIQDIIDYGEELLNYSNYMNEVLFNLIQNDNNTQFLSKLDEELRELSPEAKMELSKNQSFLDKFLSKNSISYELTQEERFRRIGQLQKELLEQIKVLQKEIKQYLYMKEYIQIFLDKLLKYVKQLNEFNKKLDQNSYGNDMTKFDLQFLLITTKEKIITFTSMIPVLEQELVMINQAILSHNKMLNALLLSNTSILPLLSTKIVTTIGNKNENYGEELVENLFGLLSGIINDDSVEVRKRLGRINEKGLSPLTSAVEEYMNENQISHEITDYVVERVDDSHNQERIDTILETPLDIGYVYKQTYGQRRV